MAYCEHTGGGKVARIEVDKRLHQLNMVGGRQGTNELACVLIPVLSTPTAPVVTEEIVAFVELGRFRPARTAGHPVKLEMV